MNGLRTVQIVYFSGTGGTARVAAALAAAFTAREKETILLELNGKPATQADADLLMVLFPVYAANAPLPIDEWIAGAPEGRGKPAAVVSVSGGGEIFPNTACRTDVIRRLENKGYRVTYERMFVMPSNFLLAYSDDLSALLFREATHRAEQTAEELLTGRTLRTRPHLWDKAISRICTVEKRKCHIFGERLSVNTRCAGCGWCESQCPRGNIRLLDGKPVFTDRCVFCLRCVYGCPQKAIEPGIARFAVIKDGFDLDAAEARTQGKTEFPPVESLAKGIVFKGVRRNLLERE